MKKLVQVTQEDIEEAYIKIKKGNPTCCCCPNALAIQRAFNNEDLKVEFDNSYVVNSGDFPEEILLPQRGQKIATQFDTWHVMNSTIKPSKYFLELPDKWFK